MRWVLPGCQHMHMLSLTLGVAWCKSRCGRFRLNSLVSSASPDRCSLRLLQLQVLLPAVAYMDDVAVSHAVSLSSTSLSSICSICTRCNG